MSDPGKPDPRDASDPDTPTELRLDHSFDLPSPTGDPLPDAIGPYHVIRLLGRGGMGCVYEAEQTNPKRRVALKVVSTVAVPEVLRRLEHEAQVLGRLQHPGIAQIIEAGTFDHGRGSQPYFAMEFVEGRNLTDHARSADLDLRARLDLFLPICDAVHHAHQRGVVHRDLKPANILVGPNGAPKVLDFGLARITESDRVETQLTAVGQVVGTLAYMSPEQARGEPDLDTGSDVYSLGVVLYELLSGDLPYAVRGRAIHDAIRVVTEDEPTRLGSRVADLLGDVETIVHKALSKDRRERYESAAALAADIRRYLADEPILARPPTAMYQLAKFARRNRALVAAAALVLLSLTAGLVVSLVSLSRVSTARAAEEREAETARAINEFILQDMLRAANPFHGGRHVRVIDVLDAAAPRIESAFRDRPLVRAEVRKTLGTTYRELGLWTEAEPMLRSAAREVSEKLGRDHPDALEARYEHAIVLSLLRDESSIGILSELYERWRELLGPKHPRTLRALGDRGNVLASFGRFEVGEPLAREAYETCLAELGADHEATQANQRKLGEVLEATGRYAEARALVGELLQRRETLYGSDDPDALDLRVKLAALLAEDARFDEAERMIIVAIDGLDRVFGAGNVRSLEARSALADVYDRTGRRDEATRLHQEVCEGYERALGRSHPYTLLVRSNVAIHLRRRGQYDEAERIAREVLAERRAVLVSDDESIAESLDVLGAILQQRGEGEGAAAKYDEAIAIAERALGPEHPRTVDIVYNRASLAFDMGDYERAAREFRRLAAVEARLRGETHPFVAAELSMLGRSLAGAGRDEEALAAFLDALDRRERAGAGESAEACGARARVAWMLLRLKRPAEAEEYAHAAYRRLKELDDDRSLRRYEVVEALVAVCEALKRPEDAGIYRRELESLGSGER